MSVARDIVMPGWTYYAREIEKHWKNKEKQRRKYEFSSPQLSLRSNLVLWLKTVCSKIEVSFRTLHLAVSILDVFMDKHSIEKDRLGFVALVCVMLAAKFEEADSKIPEISELNKFDGFRYSNKDFIKIEAMVLTFLDFQLAQPTVANFAEYYTMFTITHHDLQSQNYSLRQLANISFNIMAELLDICLKEVNLVPYPPSQVAAASVLVTRRHMGLTPSWTSVLAEITGYTEEAISSCADLLMRKLKQEYSKKNLQSPDHGYVSDNTPSV